MDNYLLGIALNALKRINHDDEKDHNITTIMVPKNGDCNIRICEDFTNNGTFYYLLKLDEKSHQFIQFVKGKTPDIPPVDWQDIP